MKSKIAVGISVGTLLALAVAGLALAEPLSIAFEAPNYTIGNIHGQDGWSKTGGYDAAVVANSYGHASFGGQSLRISNAMTSGSFGDQTFSRPLVDEAGETSAYVASPSGTRQPYLVAEWDFASTVPAAEQPGLSVVASPDRGDGGRMSWVQMRDTATGLEVNFIDYQDAAPYGSAGSPADGIGAGDAFVQTTVASGLDRTVPHSVRLEMSLLDGPRNDIVKVYVDGTLVHTGTSWEDYFRWKQGPGDPEQTAPVRESRVIRTLLFRVGGTAAPATLGNGFLIDNLELTSGPLPQCSAICYVDGTIGNDAFSGETPATAKQTIQAGLAQVSPGGTVQVAAGTYAEDLVITKPLTLAGAGQGSTTVYPATSGPICSPGSICPGGTNVVLVQASNVLLRDLTIDGDNPALVSGVSVGGADLDARNGIITNHPLGTFNNLEVHHVTVRNIYLRGVYASSGGSFNLHDNVVENVQGEAASIAMFNFGGSGVFAGNTVSGANDAISSNWSTGVQFLNNTITNSASGIHTDNAGTSGSADLIEGNAVSDCTPGGYGIWVFVPYLAHTVNANTVTNCAVGLSAWGQGAAVTPSFTNNTVTGTYEAGGAGAYITTDRIGFGYTDVSVAFSGNIITGNETGVYLTADEQSWNPEPYTAQAITAVFGQNNLAGNTTGVDKGTSGTINADFEHNWWGDASGPSGAGPGTGVSVTTGVDFEPWLCDGTDTSGAPGFQPAASSCGAGPIATDVAANPNPAAVGVASTLTANIDDTSTGGSVITSAEYQVNGGAWQPMAPSDGMFDSVSEDVTVTLSGSPLPDVFTLCVRGTDASGAVGTPACTLLAVYDPSAGFVTGGGWIDSPAGAYAPDPTLTGRANFGFVAKYKKGANVPDGNTEFAFQAGNLNFRSSSYEWLVVNQNATNAQFKGTGTINGTGSYQFMLWATDANPDTFRMKIWSESNGSETIVYDNGTGQALGGGSIIVHKPK